MTTRRKILLYATPILILSAITACSVDAAYRAEVRERHAKAEATRARLEAKRWKESAESGEKRLWGIVDGLRTELDEAKAAGAKPLIVTRYVTGDATWAVPDCETSPAGVARAREDATLPRDLAAPPESPAGGDCPPGTPGCLAVRARIETAVVADATGRPYLRTLAWATPRLGAWEGPERLLPEGEVTVGHDPILRKALDAFFARNQERRLDLLAGGSLGTDSYGLAAGAAGGGRRFGWWAVADVSRRDPGDGYVEIDQGYFARTGAVPETEVRVLGGLRLSLR